MVNNSQVFGAMLEGLERISSLITRYTMIERRYLQGASGELTDAVVKLYVAVLTYLSKARRYFDRRISGMLVIRLRDTRLI
jgi:hypothetical protein